MVAAPEIERFAAMALGSIHREYPNHLSHLLASRADARTPRELHPAFYGSFDWHSAVHGHWCLTRALRCAPEMTCAREAREALARNLTPEHIGTEVDYMSVEGRAGFERPYGLAWLLQLGTELREWRDPDAGEWSRVLAPLEQLCARRISEWLPKLRWPNRSGEHGQTAFALRLALDWARVAGERAFERLIEDRARDFFGADRNAPIAYEPSGHDFLSPTFAEADLMRCVLEPEKFATWLDVFLPDSRPAEVGQSLTPVETRDRADGKLAHLDGLNLSRAWMLEGIVAALPRAHRATRVLEAAGERHREAGLAGATGEHYAGSHWLGSFAVFLLTRRGLAAG